MNEIELNEDKISFYDIWSIKLYLFCFIEERNLSEGKLLKDIMKSYFYIYRINI